MRSSLTQRQMREYDHEALADTIVRRLSELSVEEKHRAHINAWTNNRASPSAAFLATDANIPKLNKDPIKNARPSCAICGNAGHTEEQCFPNELASCPKAISRAPVGTPLYHKHQHPISVGSQPPLRSRQALLRLCRSRPRGIILAAIKTRGRASLGGYASSMRTPHR